MLHDVWKTAGALGPTDMDRSEALGAGAATAAPLAALRMAGGLGLKGQELLDRRKAFDEFGTLSELLVKVHKQNPELDLPGVLRIVQTNIQEDPLQTGYAALPRLWADITNNLEELHIPWSMRPFRPQGHSGEVWRLGEEMARQAKPAEVGADAIEAVRKATAREIAIDRVLRDRVPYSPSVIMHELGHLSNADKKKIKALHLLGAFGPAAGSAGAIAAALSDDETANALAPGIAVAGWTPTLIEEARASRNARGIMKKMIDAGEQAPNKMKALYRALGPAYGTYVMSAAIPTVASAVIAKHMRDKRERGLMGDVWAHAKQLAHNVGTGAGVSGEALETAGEVAGDAYSALASVF